MGEYLENYGPAACSGGAPGEDCFQLWPQPLKRRDVFSDLTAPFGSAQGRLELVPFPIWRRERANLRVGLWSGCGAASGFRFTEELPETAQELPALQGSLRLRSGQALRLRNFFAFREAVSSLRMTELMANGRDASGDRTAPLKPRGGLSGPPVAKSSLRSAPRSLLSSLASS